MPRGDLERDRHSPTALVDAFALDRITALREDPQVRREAFPAHEGTARFIRDRPRRGWDRVDEQVDESFPASDPPGNY